MRGNEGFNFASSSNANSGTFILKGGIYMVAVIAASFGTIDLQVQGPDGSTFLNVGSSTNFTANGVAIVDLAPGLYKFANTTVTGIYESVTRVPGE